jgi:hypothetical protein
MTSSTFTKRELINKFHFSTPSVDARAIQNPAPATTAHFGPLFHALGKALSADWHPDAQIHYTSGNDSVSLGQWFARLVEVAGPGGFFLDSDGSRWDGHVSMEGMLMEAAIDALYGAALDAQLANYPTRARIWWRRVILLICAAFRLSGKPDTSVGNSKGNAVAGFKAIKALGAIRSTGWSFGVLGDDNGAAFSTEFDPDTTSAAWKAAYESFGHEVKVNTTPARRPLSFSYNSGRFYLTAAGPRVWAPRAGRALAKMGWQILSPMALPPAQWLRSAGTSWSHDVNHVPVLRAFAARMLALSRSETDPGPVAPFRFVDGDRRHHAAAQQECCPDAIFEFCEEYDLMPDDIASAEAYLSTALPGADLDHWVIDQICDHDLGEGDPDAPADVDCTLLTLPTPTPVVPTTFPLYAENAELFADDIPLDRERRIAFRTRLRSVARLAPEPIPLCLLACIVHPRASPQTDVAPHHELKESIPPPCSPHNPCMSNVKPRKSRPAKETVAVEVVVAPSGGNAGSAARSATVPRAPRGKARNASTAAPRTRARAETAQQANRANRPSDVVARRTERSDRQRLASNVRGSRVSRRKNGLTPMQNAVMRCLLMPLSGPAFRFPGPGSERETAVTLPYFRQPSASTFGTGNSTAAGYFPDGQSFAIARRDPRCAAIIHDSNVAADFWGYNQTFDGFVPYGNPVPLSELTTGETYSPHGPVQLAGVRADGVPAIWIDAGSDAYTGTETEVAFGGLTPLATYTFFVERYVSGEVSEYAGAFTVGGDGDAGILLGYGQSGYWSFTLTGGPTGTTTPPIGFLIATRGQSSVICHLPAPGYLANRGVINNYRTNAASIMWSNEMTDLTKGGHVNGYQVSGEREWPSVFGVLPGGVFPAAINPGLVSAFPGAQQLVSDKGIYGWLKPAELSDFTLYDIAGSMGAPPGPSALIAGANLWSVSDSADYILVFLDVVSAQIESLPKGCLLGTWTLAYAGEFETDDQWHPKLAPSMATPEFEILLKTVATCPQWMENPSHGKNILDFVGSAAPALGSMFGPQGAALGGVIGMGANLIGSLFG